MNNDCSLGEFLTNLFETMKIFTMPEDILDFTRCQMELTKAFIIIFIVLGNMWIDILQGKQEKPHL